MNLDRKQRKMWNTIDSVELRNAILCGTRYFHARECEMAIFTRDDDSSALLNCEIRCEKLRDCAAPSPRVQGTPQDLKTGLARLKQFKYG
jgi:hypothetical protein